MVCTIVYNVVAKEEGIPEAVLIRAIEPIEGLDQMAINRFERSIRIYPIIKRKIYLMGQENYVLH